MPLVLSKAVQGLAKGGPAASYIPILATELSTWEAARQLAAASPAILPTSTHKIQEAKVGLLSIRRPGPKESRCASIVQVLGVCLGGGAHPAESCLCLQDPVWGP